MFKSRLMSDLWISDAELQKKMLELEELLDQTIVAYEMNKNTIHAHKCEEAMLKAEQEFMEASAKIIEKM